jgi:hypothetical protein
MASKIRNEKCKNHEVSRCLLLNWLDSSVEPARIHYFDLADNQQKFEIGKRATFATTNYIYTPMLTSGARASGFEDWLSVDEGGLGLLAKAAHSSSPGLLPKDARFMSRAIRACIALGCRSAYGFYMISQIPRLADMLEVDSVHEAVVTMSLEAMRKKFIQFSNWDFTVINNLPGNLIINEQPFRDWTLRGNLFPAVTMPLAPRALLYGQPPKSLRSRQMTLAWVSAPDRLSLVERHNKFVIETARQWVVGRNANVISDISPDLSDDRVQQRRAADSAAFRYGLASGRLLGGETTSSKSGTSPSTCAASSRP